MESVNRNEGAYPLSANQGLSGSELLKAPKETNHSDDVKKAANKERVEAFLADTGKISEVLQEGKHNKVTAFLQRHPKLTFLLGGATLALSGLAFVGAVAAGSALLAGGVALIIVPALLIPPLAPAGLIVGVCFGSALLATAAFVGTPVAPLPFVLAGAWLGMAGIDGMIGTPSSKSFDAIKDDMAKTGATPQDIEEGIKHLKRAHFFENIRVAAPLNTDTRAELAFEIKFSSGLTLESKKRLLESLAKGKENVAKDYREAIINDAPLVKTQQEKAHIATVIQDTNLSHKSKDALLEMLTNASNLDEVKSEIKAALTWEQPIESNPELFRHLKSLLPQHQVSNILSAPVGSYVDRCDAVFEALKQSQFVLAAKDKHDDLDSSPFKATRAEALVQAALEDKKLYYQQAFVNAPYEQLHTIEQQGILR